MAPPRSTSAIDACLDDLLIYRLGLAGRLVRSRADSELGEGHVGAQPLALLSRLAEEDGLTQADLARRGRVEGPTVCRMVDRLTRDGLVERRPSPGDRRAVHVHLTPLGREAAAHGLAVIEGLERRLLAGLDRDDQARLADLLDHVLAALPGPDAA